MVGRQRDRLGPHRRRVGARVPRRSPDRRGGRARHRARARSTAVPTGLAAGASLGARRDRERGDLERLGQVAPPRERSSKRPRPTPGRRRRLPGAVSHGRWLRALARRGDSEPAPRPGRQPGKVRPCRVALSRSRARCSVGALGRLAASPHGSGAALAAPRRRAARAAGLLRNAGATASVPGLPAARCMWSFAATPPFQLFAARLRVRARRRHRGNAYDLR
jgi:hypothetical protein